MNNTEQEFIQSVMSQITDWMSTNNISRAELARRLGTSSANVTQMLAGRNITLSTLFSTTEAIGCTINLQLEKTQCSPSLKAAT